MRVIIFGNGGIRSDLREAVETADLVVRMNKCESQGLLTGSRTDILAITNTGPPPIGMLERTDEKFVAAFDEARWILLPRNSLTNLYYSSSPGNAEYFENHDHEIVQAARAADKAILRAGPIESFYLFKKLLTLQDDDFLMPSTGACVVNYFSRRALASDHILLAGFQHIGWEGHPWSAEKELFRLYANLDNIDVVD